MKAPDKIYIPIHQSYPNAPIDEKNTHLGADWYVSKCDQTAVGFHEYIRKDALLEWAKGLYEKTMTFVSGDIERDNEIQMFALRISKHIEQL